MLIETVKLSCLFLIVFIAMRLLGKTLLSQWTAYDLVTVIFLAYAALGAVKIDGFFHALLCIALIMFLYFLLSKLSLHRVFKYLIIGYPTTLIQHGEVIPDNLKHSRYSLTELLSTIRASGYPNVDEIEYAILEPNGQISVLPKANLRSLTPLDLNLTMERTQLPITLIEEAKILEKNLELIEKNKTWLEQELLSKGFLLNQIFYAYYKGSRELIVFPYENEVESKD